MLLHVYKVLTKIFLVLLFTVTEQLNHCATRLFPTIEGALKPSTSVCRLSVVYLSETFIQPITPRVGLETQTFYTWY